MISDRPTVGVVGAGFSGLLTALRLLEVPGGPRVRLFERGPQFGRGAAYAAVETQHLLNVRAANMSAFPEAPGHFVEWLARDGQADAGSAFVSRPRYGAYLQSMLRQAAEAAEAGRLILEADSAVALERRGGGLILTMGVGRRVPLDAAVLAIGNLPPHRPTGFTPEAAAHPAFAAEPWKLRPEDVPEEGLVLLIGTGLTMVDVALHVAAERPGVRMIALSRRGLLPRRHLTVGPAPEVFEPAAPDSVLGLLRELRARSHDRDWRVVIDGLRPHVQTVWKSWDLTQRERFLRHARPWWDIHRHRLAPAVASRLDHLMGSGILKVEAGRLQAVEPSPYGLRLRWRPKGGGAEQDVEAVKAINCTGPNGDLTATADPLLKGMAEDGLIRPDGCRLGLDVDPDGRLISRDGLAQDDLLAVGPITRGGFWEITSVPDIRVQAQLCARTAARHAMRQPAL